MEFKGDMDSGALLRGIFESAAADGMALSNSWSYSQLLVLRKMLGQKVMT